jgi:hypothetical protein
MGLGSNFHECKKFDFPLASLGRRDFRLTALEGKSATLNVAGLRLMPQNATVAN